MKKRKRNLIYSKLKPLKKRLPFAFSKKKSFLSTNKHIEVLDYEEKKEKKKIKLKKPAFYTGLSLSALVITIVSLLFINHSEQIKTGTIQFLAGLGIYTEEVKSVEIESNDYDSPGSWHIDKSAKWIGEGKAEITFEVSSVYKKADNNQKDIILVMDNSGSMSGTKLDQAINDSKELINFLIEDNNNRMAIITFGSDSNVLSTFTNDKSALLSILDSISPMGSTSYDAGLNKIEDVMTNYQKSDSRDLIVLFLTDGYPNEDTPKQIATYQVLKDKYPYMIINGIQYEMGIDLIPEIAQISDIQWIADQENLNNILFEASATPLVYENFVITDYLFEDFTINSVDSVSVKKGEVSLEMESGTPKIIWNLSNKYATGATEKMRIKVNLKSQYVNEEGFFPTNQKETITSKLPNETEKNINSNLTPILKNHYAVIYDANPPSGCNIESTTRENHFAFQNVTKRNDILSCQGYQFDGWKIIDEDFIDTKIINDDTFIMPQHDVHIKGTWTKQSLKKSMNGTIYQRSTLYHVLEEEGLKGTYAKRYTGEHQDSMDSSRSTKNIYYWYASNESNAATIIEKNNVIFGGFCWQMIRTTDTGGVKMIYNGLSQNNKCLDNRSFGITSTLTVNLSNGDYWYGTSYRYDESTKKAYLTGITEVNIWSEETANDLIGKYTCKGTTEDTACGYLYRIDSYVDSTTANVSYYSNTIVYSQIGTSKYANNHLSPAYVGYMYGSNEEYQTIGLSKTKDYSEQKDALTYNYPRTTYWYADSVDYGNIVPGEYTLINPYKISSLDDYSVLIGKYTFNSTNSSASASSVYYIEGNSSNTAFAYKYMNGETADNPLYYYIGESLTDNNDGTYSIDNPQRVSMSEWFDNYTDYKNMVYCESDQPTCSNPFYFYTVNRTYYSAVDAGKKIVYGKQVDDNYVLQDTITATDYEYINNYDNYSSYKITCFNTSGVCNSTNVVYLTGFSTSYAYASYLENHLYGSNITWNGTGYTLNNPININDYTGDTTPIKNHHYICLEVGTDNCPEVGYVFEGGVNTHRYILFDNENMQNIEQVLNSMLRVNTNDSLLKTAVDEWFERNLIDYEDVLEETIYCNDRGISSLGGFDPNGGNINNGSLHFQSYSSANRNLRCLLITDRFSVDNDVAKLNYKVGLLSAAEVLLSGHVSLRKTNNIYWTITPYSIANTYISSLIVDNDGAVMGSTMGAVIDSSRGVRPAISLKPGLYFEQGDGSKEDPYVVDLE